MEKNEKYQAYFARTPLKAEAKRRELEESGRFQTVIVYADRERRRWVTQAWY